MEVKEAPRLQSRLGAKASEKLKKDNSNAASQHPKLSSTSETSLLPRAKRVKSLFKFSL